MADPLVRSPTFGRQLRCTVAWAWHDCRFEWRVTLCLALAVAAVLAPLLVLFGLKSGIVGTLTAQLQADPRAREIVWKFNGPLDAAWVDALARRPEVGFLVPSTRSLAATVDLQGPNEALQDIDLLPTAPGDPLLGHGQPVPTGFGEAVLSHEAARRLGVQAGDTVEAAIARVYRQQRQTLRFPLRVVAVLDESVFAGKLVLVPLALLEACEAYRDGFAVPELGAVDGAAGPRARPPHARLRLYARTLDDVRGLAQELRVAGFEVTTRSRDVELVEQIDHALSFLFRLIAAVGVTGCLLSLAASLWANVIRKRRELALLRLIGVRERVLTVFPSVQALLIASGGLLLAFGIYAVSAELINRTFQIDLGRDEFVCRLAWRDGLLAALLTEILAVAASMIGAVAVARVDPADGVREG